MRFADEVDAHVGRRLRRRRTALGLTQEQVAQALGLTFQQIQKYEKGRNRIGAGRLYRIAGILSVQVQYFFDGMEDGTPPMGKDTASKDTAAEEIHVFAASSEGKALSSGFVRIGDPAVRRRIVDLVTTLAGAPPDT